MLSPDDGVRGAMFGLPGPPGPPGPPGHKGEPGVPSAGEWNPASGDYSNMALRVTDYIKCRWQLNVSVLITLSLLHIILLV